MGGGGKNFTFGDTSGSGVGIGVGEGGVASRVRIRGGVGVRSKEDEGEGTGALLEVGKAVEGIWTLAASEREREDFTCHEKVFCEVCDV